MVAPVSPVALINSNLDRPASSPSLVFEMTFFAMLMVIGMSSLLVVVHWIDIQVSTKLTMEFTHSI